MRIAREKRKQNIIEYILYMYQVEDTIRACNFDMEQLEQRVILQYKVSEKEKQEVRNWYSDIILMMHEEGIKQSGHMSMLNQLIDELQSLHSKLLNEIRDTKYTQQYGFALQNIRELEKKLGDKPESDIQTCLNALYALLLLRLQKKTISQETMEAMQTFSNLLGLLAAWFKKQEEAR